MKTPLLATLLAVFTISCSCIHSKTAVEKPEATNVVENLPTKKWEASHINFVLFPSGPMWRYFASVIAASKAAETWNDTGIGPKIKIHTPDPRLPANPTISQDGVNGIYFVDEEWTLKNRIAGYTFSANDEGLITEVDIILNAEHFKWDFGETIDKETMDIETILVHELGHALGLNHVNNKDAIMYTYAEKGEIVRKLHPDDLIQLTYLYPPKKVEEPVVANTNPLVGLAEWVKGLF